MMSLRDLLIPRISKNRRETHPSYAKVLDKPTDSEFISYAKVLDKPTDSEFISYAKVLDKPTDSICNPKLSDTISTPKLNESSNCSSKNEDTTPTCYTPASTDVTTSTQFDRSYSSLSETTNIMTLTPQHDKHLCSGIPSINSNANYVRAAYNPRLFWTCTNDTPCNTSSTHFFNTDHCFVYEPFYEDFGPLNIANVYRYCEFITFKTTDPKLPKNIVHYCSTNKKFRTNAALLFCAYQVVGEGLTAERAYEPFLHIWPPFLSYRDAATGACTFHISLYECLQAIEYAQKLGWFSLSTFDIDDYESNEKIENGDINWIIPNKFVAFSSPTSSQMPNDYYSFTPKSYAEKFCQMGMKLVIRLNRKEYDRRDFTRNGIRHKDLYFLDGSCPSFEIVQKFIQLCEDERGPIAVHCKAGLGRTGTLIGCYAMKNYGFHPKLWIAWNRLCRPGSILGPQQLFLSTIQPLVLKLLPKCRAGGIANAAASSPQSSKRKKDSKNGSNVSDLALNDQEGNNIASWGDEGQGDRLMISKHGTLRRILLGDEITQTSKLKDDVYTPLSSASTTTSMASTAACQRKLNRRRTPTPCPTKPSINSAATEIPSSSIVKPTTPHRSQLTSSDNTLNCSNPIPSSPHIGNN